MPNLHTLDLRDCELADASAPVVDGLFAAVSQSNLTSRMRVLLLPEIRRSPYNYLDRKDVLIGSLLWLYSTGCGVDGVSSAARAAAALPLTTLQLLVESASVDLTALANAAQLRHLCCYANSSCLQLLPSIGHQLISLELHVGRLERSDDDGEGVTHAELLLLPALSACPHLDSLSLVCDHLLLGQSIIRRSRLPAIRRLRLDCGEQRGKSHAAQLSELLCVFPSLEQCELSMSLALARAFEPLSRMPHLRTLLIRCSPLCQNSAFNQAAAALRTVAEQQRQGSLAGVRHGLAARLARSAHQPRHFPCLQSFVLKAPSERPAWQEDIDHQLFFALTTLLVSSPLHTLVLTSLRWPTKLLYLLSSLSHLRYLRLSTGCVEEGALHPPCLMEHRCRYQNEQLDPWHANNLPSWRCDTPTPMDLLADELSSAHIAADCCTVADNASSARFDDCTDVTRRAFFDSITVSRVAQIEENRQ